jgi:hypothetical protein
MLSIPFSSRSGLEVTRIQYEQPESGGEVEAAPVLDPHSEVDALIDAFDTLSRATDRVLSVTRLFGVPDAVVLTATSWDEFIIVFAEAVFAICRAEAAETIEALESELRQLGASISTAVSRDEIDGASATVAAVDILRFLADNVLPPERGGRWFGVIEHQLRTGRQHVLCETAASAAKARPGPHPETFERYLQRFTRRIVGLPRASWDAVAIAIAEGRWRSTEKPVAYVRTVAQAIAGREARGGLDHRSSDVMAQLGSEAPHSLDLPRPGRELTDDPLAALIPDHQGDQAFGDIVSATDLEAALVRAGLGADGIALAQARVDGVPRSAMAEHLGWSPQKVRKVEQALRRAQSRLRADLMA